MSSTSIRVCIVEDDQATREGFEELIRHSPEIEFVAAFPSAEIAEREIAELMPDIVLTDINLPGRSGIDCVRKLKAAHPKIEFLMLTTYDDSKMIFDSLRAGASGYVLKRSAVAELLDAILEVRRGGSPMSMQIARKVVTHFYEIPSPRSDIDKLTNREQEILALLAEGALYKEIADKLGISQGVVRNYLHGIYAKLHVQSRTQAVVKYLGR